MLGFYLMPEHLGSPPQHYQGYTSISSVRQKLKFYTKSKCQVTSVLVCRLTDAVCVRHAFPRHAVPPQALVHVAAGVTVLHPIIRCRGDDQEYVPHSSAEQPTSHEAVHPAKIY